VEEWAGVEAMSQARSMCPDRAKERILTQAALVQPELQTKDALKLFGL